MFHVKHRVKALRDGIDNVVCSSLVPYQSLATFAAKTA